MHGRLFLDSMHRVGIRGQGWVILTGGLQGQAGLRSWLPSSRHMPALVISARAYLHLR